MPAPGFSSYKSDKKTDANKQQVHQQQRKDPYEVLGVPRNATDAEIKSAYRKMALRYHPDKNANDPLAADTFKEITFSYNILSNPDRRHQYDTSGFEAIESDSQEIELDLSSLGTVNTMFAALFSKLGVPIKTTISATVLEEALNGTMAVRPLPLGQSISRKVEKQSAHFYSIELTEREAQAGVVCRVYSSEKSKFKLLYFEKEENGGLSLALQEDSAKTGKVTSAGMFFLRFPVFRFDASQTIAVAKDPTAAFFKKLDGFQACEINELKAGTHVFAVYGDNFFKSINYTIEVMCAEQFTEEKEKHRDVEAKILVKRAELSKFETEYREVLTKFTEMNNRYAQEMQAVDELLKERNSIHASYTAASLKRNSTSSKMSSPFNASQSVDECPTKEKKPRDRTRRKKWFKIHLKDLLMEMDNWKVSNSMDNSKPANSMTPYTKHHQQGECLGCCHYSNLWHQSKERKPSVNVHFTPANQNPKESEVPSFLHPCFSLIKLMVIYENLAIFCVIKGNFICEHESFCHFISPAEPQDADNINIILYEVWTGAKQTRHISSRPNQSYGSFTYPHKHSILSLLRLG